jgi:hypothetical protein
MLASGDSPLQEYPSFLALASWTFRVWKIPYADDAPDLLGTILKPDSHYPIALRTLVWRGVSFVAASLANVA